MNNTPDRRHARMLALGCFVAVTAINSIVLALAQGTRDGWVTAGLALLVFPILAYYAYRRHLLITWVTIVLMLLYGAGFVHDGVSALLGGGGSVAAVVRLAAGGALAWSGLVIFQTRPEA